MEFTDPYEILYAGDELSGEGGVGERGGETDFAEDVDMDAGDDRDIEEMGLDRDTDLDFGRDFRSQMGGRPEREPAMKKLRSPPEVALDQIKGIINVEEVSQRRYNNIISFIERLENMHLYNLETLILATQFILDGHELAPKSFANFVKMVESGSRKIFVPPTLTNTTIRARSP